MAAEPPIERLSAERPRFVRFARRRIADPELAEDIVQDALLRATTSAPDVGNERLLSWFYRVLRNAITDAHRRHAVRSRHLAPLPDGMEVAEDEREADRIFCECFRELVLTLKPEYAELIDRVELGGETLESAAARLGITLNNLNVRRHRARGALRDRLNRRCGACAALGCLDCSCRRRRD